MNMPITWLADSLDETGREIDMTALAIEIADEACRVDIECHAMSVPTNYPAPVYDVTALEPGHLNDEDLQAADQAAIDRAVRYLDLRGLIVRPWSDSPHLVRFAERAA